MLTDPIGTNMELDLRTALSEILPSAIEWAKAQQQIIFSAGRALNEQELKIARRVGVKSPELIRVMFIDQLPLPEDPILKQAAIQTGLLGPGMIGMTFGHGIYIVQGHDTARLLSHECRHVYQYETLGSIERFLPVYLQQIVTLGYEASPLEQDARVHEINRM